ncbi:alanyl-tRNA editing protein [Candidatus Woesearchaeota archaeon]|nr:alanyl-tRNA editing protein [Candidatus Woesearchaeota archaeon]
MTKALYLYDCYLKEFDAKVLSVTDDKYVVLDQTAFYPSSGGQPHDTGVMLCDDVEYLVIYVGKFSGSISHEVTKPGLKVGDTVHCKIDWNRRYTLMRYHTGSHVLIGFFSNELGAKITGNQLGVDRSRIDLNIQNFDRELFEKMIEKSNDLIKKDLPVKFYDMTREDVLKDPQLIKLAAGLPEGIKNLRIVEIEGFDKQPDGGTHLKSLKDIGTIKFLKADNKGANNRRFYFTLE